jgi:ATP-dependent 26S proteasome regulatory subunit
MDSTVLIYGMWLQKRKLLASSAEDENSADTCSGLSAIKDYRDAINQDDFNKAVRKMAETKKLESKLEYQKL